MATLQSIRSKGPLLVVVIGVALLAFLAGDFFKVFQTHSNKTNVGSVDGESYSVMDFQQRVNEEAESYKARTGRSLNDREMSQVRDQVWQAFVLEQLVNEQASKLGLVVTDDELQNVIEAGVNPILMQAPVGVNPQTGRFDKDILKEFLVNYSTQRSQMDPQMVQMYDMLHSQWLSFEADLRLQLLVQKYQSLIASSMLSNTVETEYMQEGRTTQYDALYAAYPYRSMPDSAVTVTDADLKVLYDKYRESRFKQAEEGCDIKYVQVTITASDKDKADLLRRMTETASTLRGKVDNYFAQVRANESTETYVDMLRTKDAFPRDVTSRLDTVAVGEVVGPYMNVGDNTYNVFKLIAKSNQADSVNFRNIVVARPTQEATQALADSIMTAVKGGADFNALADKYNGPGQPQWVYSAQFNAGIDEQNAKYFSELFAAAEGALYQSKVSDMTVITKVFEKRGSKEKYNLAIVKCPITFSDETYSAEYNKFSQFVAGNQTIDAITANAEAAGYRVQEQRDLLSSGYGIGNVANSREALRWAFNAEVGDVSQVFECGDDNNTMLVLALTGRHEKGYLAFDYVKDQLRPEAIRDKKAEKIMADWKARNLTSIDAYKSLPDVVCDTLKKITFAAPVNVMRIGGGEYVLNGLAAKSQLNQLTQPVKGNAAVYVLDVYSTNKTNENTNDENELRIISMTYQRSASAIFSDLVDKADIEDERYLFF